MNNVASLELCKELYELSGFDWLPENNQWHREGIPAYDLGYLLRKLPRKIDDPKWPIATLMMICPAANYYYGYTTPTGEKWPFDQRSVIFGKADTPEDAATKLCIELFKKGILTKENTNGTN